MERQAGREGAAEGFRGSLFETSRSPLSVETQTCQSAVFDWRLVGIMEKAKYSSGQTIITDPQRASGCERLEWSGFMKRRESHCREKPS